LQQVSSFSLSKEAKTRRPPTDNNGEGTQRMRASALLVVHVAPLLLLPAPILGLTLPTRPSHLSNKKAPPSSSSRQAALLLKARGGDASAEDGHGAPIVALLVPSASSSSVARSVSRGYRARVAADPNFLAKSLLEVILAAGSQMAAEVSRRGARGCATEVDFVVAGVLTAIAGKYYSSWRVAPTAAPEGGGDVGGDGGDAAAAAAAAAAGAAGADASAAVPAGTRDSASGFWSRVPTNAFQPYQLDGKTRPTAAERLGALLAPIPTLFRAGVIASAIGYGMTSLLISLRSSLLPDYVSPTVNVNIVHACVYTGAFMSIVSNIRYQLLQGIIEPHIIDRFFRRWPPLQAAATFGVRFANGLLGSMLAIAGMKYFGLQKLK
jgi:hypothetical protein